MSEGVGSTPQGTAPTAPAQIVTQSDLEDRVASAFVDSLEESEQPKKPAAPRKSEPEAPDEESTDAEDSDAGESEPPPESEEEEGEAEEDSASEEEEEPKPSKRQPGDDVEVTLDDGQKVTLRELKRGFLRESDYTRKTQEVAQTRRQLESERATLTQTAKQQTEAFEVAAALIQQQMPPVPDVSLIQSNPQLYLQQQALRQQAIEKLQTLAMARQENDRIQAEEAKGRERARVEELKQLREQEHALLLQRMPKLRDEKALEAFVADAIEVGGKAWGIKPEQIRNIFSHVEAMILHDAVAWRKYQSSKMRAVAEAKQSPPLRPSPRQAPGQKVKAKKAEALSVLKSQSATEDQRMAAAMASLPDDLF